MLLRSSICICPINIGIYLKKKRIIGQENKKIKVRKIPVDNIASQKYPLLEKLNYHG